MSQIRLLTQLKNQLSEFFSELIDQFPNEPDLVIIQIFLDNQIPIVDVMKYISTKLVPLKPLIEKRDDNFFLQHNILFEKLDGNKVNHFKNLWTSGVLDESNKQIIWDWFELFIKIAEKYEKLQEIKVLNKCLSDFHF